MITAEDKKFLVNTIWEALQSPKWTKDDLVDFGTAIFSGKKLKDMKEITFNKIFPFLEVITMSVSDSLNKKGEDLLKEIKEKEEPEAGKTKEAESAKASDEEKPEEVSP